MSVPFSTIRQSALMLSVKEREILANELFDSLSTASKKQIEKAWINEAEERYSQIVKGKTSLVSSKKVSKTISNLL